jgi:hypothetical protein
VRKSAYAAAKSHARTPPEVRNAVRYEYIDFVGASQRYNHEVHELVRFWPGR